MVSDYKNRVTITRYSDPSQTDTGGLMPGTSTSWIKWAKIENRNGSLGQFKGREWNYDYKITVRYQPSKEEKNGDFVTYDKGKMVIRSVEFSGEGVRRLVILRCSKHE